MIIVWAEIDLVQRKKIFFLFLKVVLQWVSKLNHWYDISDDPSNKSRLMFLQYETLNEDMVASAWRFFFVQDLFSVHWKTSHKCIHVFSNKLNVYINKILIRHLRFLVDKLCNVPDSFTGYCIYCYSTWIVLYFVKETFCFVIPFVKYEFIGK